MNVSFKVENCSISVPTLVAACDGCPQQPVLDEERDYRRKVPIDSVMRGCVNEGCANHSGGYANP